MSGTRKVGNGGTRDIQVCLYKITNGSIGISVFEGQTDWNRIGVSNLIDRKDWCYFYNSRVIIGLDLIRGQ